MLPLYLMSLGLGGVLVSVSVLLGGSGGDVDHDTDFDLDGDVDVDVDVDMDVDVDVDVDADADFDIEPAGHAELDLAKDIDLGQVGDAAEAFWMPLLSMRFWTFFATAFGAIGTMLSLLSVNPMVTAVLAIGVGFAIGYLVAWAFRKLSKKLVSGATSLTGLRGEEATVLLEVAPGELGKIFCQTSAGRVEMMARTQDDRPLRQGSKVLIASVKDGVANISSLPPHRLLPKKELTS